ncbi:OLC1v1018357C1 [Oldenlandia corymbosa var. corymbosa]|uniref:OLC1v1018357C1 n=1 Tax=Oldenlandia corymbosa var. corymbosa TaxID=529605 RepID=A0AAV1EBI4_OLDCO|nr:OLC1v1018357C1 [Oldenlandia corymbosa var. corymbosa]
MKTPNLCYSIILLFLSILLPCSILAESITENGYEGFLQCLHYQNSNTNASIFSVLYTPKNSSLYTSTLQSGIQNQRFTLPPFVSKPLVIITPLNYLQVQSVVSCAKRNDIQIRTRGGGHDYEGLSYMSYYPNPFVVVDLRNFISISVDTKDRTAWVQAGARLGQVYYTIAQKSPNFGFPAGLCPTVGVGGHLSGGGEGTLSRKYGMAADHIIDAKVVNANGEILDRKSMGEDMFWAIRGGGGASFGIILEYKINLVYVPSTVTVFTVNRTLEQNATKLVHLWQTIAPKFDRDLFIRIIIRQTTQEGKITVQAAFNSIYLGRADKLLRIMKQSFPELGLRKEDCKEMRWIEAALYFSDLPSGSTVNDLPRRDPYPKTYYKAKSDYVVEPLSETALVGIWKLFKEPRAELAQMILAPYGGIMEEIPESEIPFPHRAGNLYQIQHLVYWRPNNNTKSQLYIDWIRELYRYMTPFVSHSPRASYFNYRDLDLGVNKEDNTSFAEASAWGFMYFKNNFYRLARVKAAVDPTNFFRYEQSIPPFESF